MNFVTNTGATFEHAIEVAVPSPVATAGSLWSQAILDVFVASGLRRMIFGILTCHGSVMESVPGKTTSLISHQIWIYIWPGFYQDCDLSRSDKRPFLQIAVKVYNYIVSASTEGAVDE